MEITKKPAGTNRCSICGDWIETEAMTGWDGGHNAAPVNNGRCCGECNVRVVIPRRIRDQFRKGEGQ